jgi:hypothetical protein
MASSFTLTTEDSLKAHILIEIRKRHTEILCRELLRASIIPTEYVDKLLKADIINGKLAITVDSIMEKHRIDKITILMQKHCSASTACIIQELCS